MIREYRLVTDGKQFKVESRQRETSWGGWWQRWSHWRSVRRWELDSHDDVWQETYDTRDEPERLIAERERHDAWKARPWYPVPPRVGPACPSCGRGLPTVGNYILDSLDSWE